MQYLLLAMETSDAFAARTDPERTGPYWSAWSGYIEALQASGVLRSAAGLDSPDVATTVRVTAGTRAVQDGPYADSKEHLGGYFLIEVADLDEALEWAARCPSATYASVEVRPVLPSGG
jgi:hypothetical protein